MGTETMESKIRVVAGMPGLDCHDRGIIYLVNVLRQAGMEVVYIDKFNTPEKIVKTAIQEDADVIAMSYLNDHLYMVYFPRVVELLKEHGASDICVVVGGRVIEEDRPKLSAIGITGFFGQESSDQEIANHIVNRVKSERQKGK